MGDWECGTYVVAIVGVDGCGKSSAWSAALTTLTSRTDVVGIGDDVLAGAPDSALRRRVDLPFARFTARVTRCAKRARRGWPYRQLKSLDLIGRAHMRDHVVERERPSALLTDGDPLVNTLAWSVSSLYRRHLLDDDERVLDALRYLAGERPIPLTEVPFYARAAWQLVALNRLGIAHFGFPDLVIHLRIDGAEAMRRIERRGRALQPHESVEFLSRLAAGYDRVCRLLETRCGVPVVRLDAATISPEGIAEQVADAVIGGVGRAGDAVVEGAPSETIEVVATTISGSIRDQRKIGRIASAFRAVTERPVRVHVAESHPQARAMAHDIVGRGGRLVVSAGGAGTFNAVLEGCHLEDAIPADVRLAFLRKGSADLIGKVLRIPDDLPAAAAAIADGIAADRRLSADILEVQPLRPGGHAELRHLVGFAGLGVFGEVPRFTEARWVKLYKGILSTLFGDYGPFYTGLLLAALWWYAERARGRIVAMTLELDGERIGPAVWSTVIVVNGDLGRAFPPGRGLPFANGSFRVLALRDRGIRAGIRQLLAARDGRILDAPSRFSAIVREVSTLVASASGAPGGAVSLGLVNVDGLRMEGTGSIRFGVSGRVELVEGPQTGRTGDRGER